MVVECADVSERVRMLQLLVALLPVTHRDTLYALLKFLNVIVQHSNDVIGRNGQQVRAAEIKQMQ